MPSAPADAWKRLGELLVQRRIELAPRYRKRTAFAGDTGIHWRLLYDIERARRKSFTPETLAAVEVAYRWQPGSVARVLAGGDPVPIPEPQAVPSSPEPEPRFSDWRLQYVMDTPGLDLETRLLLVDITRAIIARQEADSNPG